MYGCRLTDGVDAFDRRALLPGLAPLTLVDAAGRGAENTAAGGSIRNVYEAQVVAALVSCLLGADRGSSGGGGDGGGSGGGGGRGQGAAGSAASGGGGGGGGGRRVAASLTASSVGVICLCKSPRWETVSCVCL